MNEELLKRELRKIADQLMKWVAESKRGGWSTHQVDPMTAKANEIYTLLGKLG